MDAFESLVSMLLRHEGYWTVPSFKVGLTKQEKRLIERHSTPRWEIDLVAYKGATNALMAVECKSFLDSRGVVFRHGGFEPRERYKLFTNEPLRAVVLNRLSTQLVERGACAPNPQVTLALAVGKIASVSNVEAMRLHFARNAWSLFDPSWIRERLLKASQAGYENDVAFVVSKLLLRSPQEVADVLANPTAD